MQVDPSGAGSSPFGQCADVVHEETKYAPLTEFERKFNVAEEE
jgi:hypothetical protein